MTDTRDTAPLVLGTEKIGKLLMQYAIPAIIAMTASSLYNMVDSIFIGHGVGPLAIAGLAITFPFMNLAAAFGSLVGVGASTLVAIKLGQKDKESATHVLGNVVMLNGIIGLVFMTVALLFLDPILLGLNEVLRASGYPQKAMAATLTAVIVNCGLDALFILGFGWGIRGAALATIAAQIIALGFELHHFSRKKSFLHFQRGIFGLKRQIVGGMLAIGLSPFLMNLCACFVVILINKSLKTYGGDLAIGAYGIVNRIVFLFIMIVMGFNQGMQPIAGYNFGARQFDRLIQVLKYTVFCGVTVTTVGFLAGQIFPRPLIYLFTSDETLTNIAVEGLRIVLICFPVVGFQMVTSSFFQSIGMAKKAIFLSLTRQLLFLIPSLLVFPSIWGTVGVWMSMPVADAIATIVAACMLRWQLKHLKA